MLQLFVPVAINVSRYLLTSMQGNLYKRIIDQVVELSRSDFEENGVTNRTVGTFQEVRISSRSSLTHA